MAVIEFIFFIFLSPVTFVYANNDFIHTHSVIRIEGFKSQSKKAGENLEIEAQWAEVTSSLKSQRLFGVRLKIERPSEILNIKAEQGLFKEDEIILSSNVEVVLSSLKSTQFGFTLVAEKDPVLFNLNSGIISGGSALLLKGNHRYKGRGYNLNLNRQNIRWLSEVVDLKLKKSFKTPILMSLK